MRWLGNVLSRMCLVISAAMALGVPVGYAALPLLPVCSWPVESTGHAREGKASKSASFARVAISLITLTH